ncbi:hypothetical protein [Cohnella faecalis]|uniref:Uncharacterized protein n=1 Tax=Cohnella faecalis TaxID=2315694 RepID=A0A398CMU5_9BACL|nr:hypothetical protein [Cohnella faecalis]RIE03933.1 hypothetical protein D3H35_08185 [Cohnella faecalis]
MLDIIFNESSININKKGAVTGEIYFNVDNEYFPGYNWSDFIVVILTWWNKSINQLELSPVGVAVNFSFMDGPFNIRGEKKENDSVTLEFIKRNASGENISISIDMSILELKRLIQKVSRNVLNVINTTNSVFNDDIEELKKIVS